MTNIFSADFKTEKELKVSVGAPIADVTRRICADVNKTLIKKGDTFAQEITDLFISDFEKPGDKMSHVSTFMPFMVPKVLRCMDRKVKFF